MGGRISGTGTVQDPEGRTEELIGPLERDQSLRLVKWNRASYSRFS